MTTRSPALSPDVTATFAPSSGSTVTVRDIMSPTVYQVKAQTSVLELVELMLGARIRRAIVTDKGKVSGIVTTSDILRLVPELLREKATR